MLLWALWLAHGLVRASAPAWRAFGHEGYWRRLAIGRRAAPSSPAAVQGEMPPSSVEERGEGS
jgi:hypothetical protein